MQKLNLNKKQNWNSLLVLALAAFTLFISCEKNEESFTQQDTKVNAITGDYTKLNATIVNSDNGSPQGIER